MSLGGKTTETQQIDPDLKAAALEQLAMAKRVGQLGFAPYKGATVAGMQPGQMAAMQNTNAGLEAFGLNPSAVPAAGDLSPYAMYQEQLAQMAPGQRAFIDAMFINPMTGQMQSGVGNATAFAQMTPGQMATEAAMRGGGGREGATTGARGTSAYNSMRDMIDGGGPGRSGKTFSGGGRMSGVANAAGISPAEGRGKNASGPGRSSAYGK